MPHRSSVPMSWRMRKNRYSVQGTKCVSCGARHMPPRAICSCGNDTMKVVPLSGNGTIISYTKIHIAPAGFEKNTPYDIALIKLDEGLVVCGIVVSGELGIGKKVRSIFRRLHTDGEQGLINYGFKFELID